MAESIKKQAQDETREERKPYEAPAIEDQAEFETLALACTSLPGNAACYGGYTTS